MNLTLEMRCTAWLLLVAAITASAEDVDAKIPVPEGLKYELVFAKKQYELGEPIEVTMRYTYTGPLALGVEVVTYDHSGRIGEFGFSATGKNGNAVRDPFDKSRGMGGGMRGSERLRSGGKYEQKIHINEWLAFDLPGVYQISSRGHIVGRVSAEGDQYYPGARFLTTCGPYQIEILPVDDAKRLAHIRELEAALKSSKWDEAVQELWYMQDERAIPTLVHCLTDKRDNVAIHAEFGLQRFKNMQPVKAELLKAVDENPEFLEPDVLYNVAQLLGQADTRTAAGKKAPWKDEYPVFENWRGTLLKKRLNRIKTLPPAQAVNQLADSFNIYGLDRWDIETWRRLLTDAELVDAKAAERLCSILMEVELDGELLPLLKRTAENPRVQPLLRSGAIVRTFNQGDRSLWDLVYDDLVLRKPVFSEEAHPTLANYKLKERTAALLQLADASCDKSLGGRIRYFATAATRAELEVAFERICTGKNPDAAREVLTALTLKAPADAFKVIQRVLNNPEGRLFQVRERALQLLCYLDLLEAKQLAASLFAKPNEQHLEEFFIGIQDAAHDKSKTSELSVEERYMPSTIAMAQAVFPEILEWLRGNPRGMAGNRGRSVLEMLTGLPKNQNTWDVSDAQNAALIAVWQKWWDEHKKDIDRSWLKEKLEHDF